MRRRDLIVLLGGASVGLPVAARAQQPERMRRVGFLMNVAADHPQGQARIAEFKQVLQRLGWSDGRNLRIDIRWGEGDADRERRYAIQATASSLGVEVSPIDVHDAGEIEHAVAAFARSPNGGLIVAPSAEASPYHNLIVTLATRHKLPAVYSDYSMVSDGGLLSYGPDRIDQIRRAAGYVDRILKGEKPADLPVQAPTKFTAKALGLAMPQSLLAAADEVIE
ncbi:MAG: ABC transporter substrate binding protein [Xanthobacteraceae bacterium]